jgi:hypothetical protein
MTDPIVEHAKATLEIVELLQMMVAECKCEAKHVMTGTTEPTGPCSVAAVGRSQHCARDWFLVCEEFAGYYAFIKNTAVWGSAWVCPDCGVDCWELMPV